MLQQTREGRVLVYHTNRNRLSLFYCTACHSVCVQGPFLLPLQCHSYNLASHCACMSYFTFTLLCMQLHARFGNCLWPMPSFLFAAQAALCIICACQTLCAADTFASESPHFISKSVTINQAPHPAGPYSAACSAGDLRKHAQRNVWKVHDTNAFNGSGSTHNNVGCHPALDHSGSAAWRHRAPRRPRLPIANGTAAGHRSRHPTRSARQGVRCATCRT